MDPDDDHPLPTLGKGKEEVNILIAQQKADDSLLEVRKNADSLGTHIFMKKVC